MFLLFLSARFYLPVQKQTSVRRRRRKGLRNEEKFTNQPQPTANTTSSGPPWIPRSRYDHLTLYRVPLPPRTTAYPLLSPHRRPRVKANKKKTREEKKQNQKTHLSPTPSPSTQDEEDAAEKFSLELETKQLGELQESRNELLSRVSNLKRDLQDWRFKLDNQVKSYRSELGDLRKTLNSEVSQLRNEFQVRAASSRQGVGCRFRASCRMYACARRQFAFGGDTESGRAAPPSLPSFIPMTPFVPLFSFSSTPKPNLALFLSSTLSCRCRAQRESGQRLD
jgi:hypothetical protein